MRKQFQENICRKNSIPSESYLRYINAYCEWARDAGVRIHRHPANRRSDNGDKLMPKRGNHLNFWSSFFESPVDHRNVDFECVSPFDHVFPAIQEVHSHTYWNHTTLHIRLMKINHRKVSQMDLNTYCILNRDRGFPEIASYMPRVDEPRSIPSYLDPFDGAFGSSVPNHHVRMTPRLETVYEAVNPFDDRFPAIERITNDIAPKTTRKRRHRLSHKERRSKIIQKKMRDYGRETILKKRQLRKAFRSIPLGLRFPSPGHKGTFISVSPFDESYPNGARMKTITKRKMPDIRTTRKAVFAAPETARSEISIQLPSLDMIPFPALTPVAAKSFARRGFFGDLSPRQQTNTVELYQRSVIETHSSMRHGLF